ncbi:MAG: hypothetical protein K0R26_2302 [Bacteroidota bacterium]|jgi:GAF domain-containing protein|nr:hypothetical protein [Bacteroidota bacterium]
MIRFQTICQEAQKMLQSGTGKRKILIYVAKEADHIFGSQSAVSILLLDEKGLLRNAISPKLPEDYIKAIDGIKPDPGLGTCAAAAATGNVVITTNFNADNKWAELKHLPISIGFAGAWSMPIKTDNGKVLGTFGTYYRQIKTPSEVELNGVRLLAQTISEVITSDNPTN